jgi:branched-chain amino acid aminotransferase
MHARAELVGGEAYETLLTNEHGAVLEGATSNFYAVVGGTVYTAGESVLEGTARRIVLYVMRRRCDDVRVELRPVTVEDIRTRRLDEAFLTSSTRGVVPIRRIDRIEIGPPGSVTRTVMRGYQTRMEELLEPLSESSA